MGYDYSVSMEGLRAAERQLNQAARKISRMGMEGVRSAGCCEAGPSGDETSDRLTLSGDMDITGAIIESRQARIQYLANLKAISMQAELEEEALDLFG